MRENEHNAPSIKFYQVGIAVEAKFGYCTNVATIVD